MRRLIDKHSAVAFCFLSVSLFLVASLASHYPSDSSFFFISDQSIPVRNWGGALGATMSALLMMLCGVGAIGMPLIMGYASFCIYQLSSFKIDWERIIAMCSLLLTGSALCYGYNLYPWGGFVSGGIVGQLLFGVLCSICGRFPALLGLYVIGLCSSMLLFRITTAQLLRIGMYGVHSFFHPVIWSTIAHWIMRLFFGISSRFYMLLRATKRLFDGSVLDRTGGSIVAFELEKAISALDEPMIESSPDCDEISIRDISSKKSHGVVPVRTSGYGSYRIPLLDFFKKYDAPRSNEPSTHQSAQARLLEEKLERFGVHGRIISIKSGPVITLFEYEPHIDSKISKIIALEDDLTLALEALSLRIIAPIPGTSVVGFEVANKKRFPVLFSQLILSKTFKKSTHKLPLALGQDTSGNQVIVDLVEMPHLLIAGSTGSGKSVALSTMLMSLLCRCRPDQLRLILIDPKRIEFASYTDIAHLLFPIVTDPQKVPSILQWVVDTMNERYETMARVGVRNIFEYHTQAEQDATCEQMPFILIMIDELSDLMMTTGREVEGLIARIAQMARAAGIHMIVATQRPSVDVITGLIKVNFPSRISCKVTSKVDSRTILDVTGAEKLLSKGDMLFINAGSMMQRIHGAYASPDEINQLVALVRTQQAPSYLEINTTNESDTGLSGADMQLYQEVVSFIETVDEVSISSLQRRFRIGYNRSARIIEKLQSQGHIMSADGGKTRKVIH